MLCIFVSRSSPKLVTLFNGAFNCRNDPRFVVGMFFDRAHEEVKINSVMNYSLESF